ncbi:MAG: URC4/urg3 family protein [Cyanobacteria bacterium Co-bin8]|nr:URC4/urg3 family protein [Cyanobacteria bacterium Co-bin8]
MIPEDPLTTIAYLQTPQAIRDRSQILFDLACQRQLDHFAVDLTKLPQAADYVLEVIRAHYPDLAVPFHSRWRHFEVNGESRLTLLEPELSAMDPLERARTLFDLAVTSVLLDAGAGAQWQYVEPETKQVFQRSEGLAIASFHCFKAGLFSSQPHQPWQADASSLTQLTAEDLATAFQVSDQNPLVGVEGRVTLLQKLGHALSKSPHLFGANLPRPGHLVDYLMTQADADQLPASAILQAILQGLGDIWPGRVTLEGVSLGDVWPHPKLPDTGLGSQLVPFHKLSQWLTYSLLEPLQALGLTITGLDALTGLAEYRNGGLFIDLEVLQPQHAAVLTQPHPPDSPLIVEWRALTVILLDQLAETLRQQLGLSSTELPLAKVLQGGTWTAGRQIAAVKRPSGPPPIQLASDGTVF